MNTVIAQIFRVAMLSLLVVPALGAQDAASGSAKAATSGELKPQGATLKEGMAARMLKPFVPAYPTAALRQGREGWVQLSFTVRPDGTAADPIVEDSSGDLEFEKVAIKSIVKNQYHPATWNGKPIEQCAAKQVYLFEIKPRQLGARSAFVKKYKAVAALVKVQRVAEAEAKLDEMIGKGAWNNYEAARLWLMRASFQGRNGDRVGERRSLQRATLENGAYLEPKVYRQALREMFVADIGVKDYAGALDTYEQIKKLKPPLRDPAVDNAVAQIRGLINGPDVLSFPGTVEYRSGCEEGRPNYQHTLLRPKFAFSAIEGRVDDFELRCDWKRVADKVSTEKAWEVPTSWGWCQVFVFGDVGSKVTVIEYPFSESIQNKRKKSVN